MLLALAVGMHGSASAQSSEPAAKSEQESAAKPDPEATVTAPKVRIQAPRFITPLPGVVIDREQMSTNVQSATAGQIRESQSINVTDYINNNLQSVSVNDYAGNPYQQDLVFRGFSASPLIGTPQGLSVYLDGVRVNEPFGEVVNWDLIPINAIQRMDLIPGSDPLFGHNTLGGALSINTKSGFTSPRVELNGQMGSFGRRQAQLSAGGNNGTLGGFLALNHFTEDGWRQNSPSTVRQIFGRVDLQGSRGSLGATFLHADNSLVGNGMVPYELYQQDRTAIFTSPDEVLNKVNHYTVNGRLDLSDSTSVSAQVYDRKLSQRSRSGDFWDDFRTAVPRLRSEASCGEVTLPDGTVLPDGIVVADGATGIDLPGCAGRIPNGVFNYGRSDQNAKGLSLQLNNVTESNQLVLGLAYDQNKIDFRQSQMLGFIDDSHRVYLTPERYDDLRLMPLNREIQRNNLTGGSKTFSAFMKNVWSIRTNLHLNAGVRYSTTQVDNYLVSDRPIPLYQFDEQLRQRLEERCGAELGGTITGGVGPVARYHCTSGNYGYRSLNPSFGLSWLPYESLNIYFNWSRGTRVPSTIELGCARDREAEQRVQGKTPGCSIPTALSSDPYLPPVTSYTTEMGLRGSLTSSMTWNASVYQTRLHDDILFVSMGSRNRGVFDTFGRTRRQGFELGLEGEIGRHWIRAAWSRVDATFESPAEVINQSNSSSGKTGRLASYRIEPGDRIPGIPRDALRLSWRYRATDAFTVGMSMVAHSWSYVRGNENNDHQPVGTDSNGDSTNGTLDPSITTQPGRKYVGSGRIPGYAIFNLLASYKVTSNFMLTARIDNLFDRRYVTAGELGLNPFVPSVWGVRDAGGFNYNSNDWTHSTFVGPGMPRAFWVGFTYMFDTGGSSGS